MVKQTTQTRTHDRPVVNWIGAPAYKLTRLFTNENKTDGPDTQHIQPREHQRPNQETGRHSDTPSFCRSLIE